MAVDTQELHAKWLSDPTPANLSVLLTALNPVIKSEALKYKGPRHVLNVKAKSLAIDAIRRYDPLSQAKVSSWVVSNLRSLSRYGTELSRPAHSPEDAIRSAASVNSERVRLSDELGRDPGDDELADAMGISVKRVIKLRSLVPAQTREGQLSIRETDDGDVSSMDAMTDDGSSGAMREAVEAVRESLDDRDKFILDSRVGRGGAPVMAAGDVAARLGISGAMVSKRADKISGMIRQYYSGG
jgi:DNA-directed RNA polymerase specialized sigma subunit